MILLLSLFLITNKRITDMTKPAPKKVAKKVLSKADFFLLKTKVVPLDVEELGTIYIKSMTASEREGLEKKMQVEIDKNGIRATVFIYSVCEEDGSLVFSDEDLESVKALPSAIVTAVFDKSNELNKLSPDAKEEAVKN